MDCIKNFRQLYCCCGCSLRIGCILIAFIEFCYPIMLTCSPLYNAEGVIIFAWILYATSTVILAYGAIYEVQPVLFGWIVYRTVVIIMTFAGFIIQVIDINDKYEENIKLTLFFITVIIFYFAVNGYFWTIVFSFYMELRDKKQRQERNTLPTITT